MTKRGRKIDPTLPPSRSRDIQRAFRARRAAYISGLEDRVRELEVENRQLRIRLGEDPPPLSEEDEPLPAKKRPKLEDDDDEDEDAPRQPSYNLRVGPNARPKHVQHKAPAVAVASSSTRPAIAVSIPTSHPQGPAYAYCLPASPVVSLPYQPGSYPIPSSSLLTSSPLSTLSAPPTLLRPVPPGGPATSASDSEQLPFWFDRSSLPPTPGEAHQAFSLSYDPSRAALPEPLRSALPVAPGSPATSTSPSASASTSSSSHLAEDGSPAQVHVKVEDEPPPLGANALRLDPTRSQFALSGMPQRDDFLWHSGQLARPPVIPGGVEPFGFGWHTSFAAPAFQTPPTPMQASLPSAARGIAQTSRAGT